MKIFNVVYLLALFICIRCEPPVSHSQYLPPQQDPSNNYLPPTGGHNSLHQQELSQSYSAPSSQYNAPITTSFGSSSPSRSYGVPSQSANIPTNSYGPPSSQSSSSYNSAPSSQYNAPISTSFGSSSPSRSYGAPSQSANIPTNSYGPPSSQTSSSYNTQKNSYRTASKPSNIYGAPSRGGASKPPSNSYGPPSQSYNPISNSLGTAGLTSAIFTKPQSSYSPSSRGASSHSQYNSGYSNGGSFSNSGYGYENDDDKYGPAKYSFEYNVLDYPTGQDFGHMESRDGDKTVGRYYVLLPDGRKQIVNYEADEHGYRPTITYEQTNNGYDSNAQSNSGGYDGNAQSKFNGY